MYSCLSHLVSMDWISQGTGHLRDHQKNLVSQEPHDKMVASIQITPGIGSEPWIPEAALPVSQKMKCLPILGGVE